MTASKKAKALGAKNLQQVAEAYGCTPQTISYMHRENPDKFEIIVLGVVQKLKQ